MSFQDAVNTILPPINGKYAHITFNADGTTNDYNASRAGHPGGIHSAVDINYEGGQSGINLQHPAIYSPVNGTVGYIGVNNGRIDIRDGDGNLHQFFHTDTQTVAKGDWVSTGDQIGTMGGWKNNSYAEIWMSPLTGKTSYLFSKDTCWRLVFVDSAYGLPLK